jgi:hypothetical protein
MQNLTNEIKELKKTKDLYHQNLNAISDYIKDTEAMLDANGIHFEHSFEFKRYQGEIYEYYSYSIEWKKADNGKWRLFYTTENQNYNHNQDSCSTPLIETSADTRISAAPFLKGLIDSMSLQLDNEAMNSSEALAIIKGLI